MVCRQFRIPSLLPRGPDVEEQWCIARNNQTASQWVEWNWMEKELEHERWTWWSLVREPLVTLARCVCSLFLALVGSDIPLVKATLTVLNWFHISLDVVFSRISILSRSLWDTARWLWEWRMLSSVNLDHESGRERLVKMENKYNKATVVRTGRSYARRHTGVVVTFGIECFIF